MSNPTASCESGQGHSPACSALNRAVLIGMFGFAAVSVGAFGIWAFAGGWFRGRGGEPAMYAAIAAAFLGLSGLFLGPLIHGPHRFRRFYGAFVPGFLAYAVVWCGFWFTMRFGAGEWLGSLAGCAAFVWCVRRVLRAGDFRTCAQAVAVLFLLHSAGYFAGGLSMQKLASPAGLELLPFLTKKGVYTLAKLSWGLFYGLGFGAGLGYVFQKIQAAELPSPSAQAASSDSSGV